MTDHQAELEAFDATMPPPVSWRDLAPGLGVWSPYHGSGTVLTVDADMATVDFPDKGPLHPAILFYRRLLAEAPGRLRKAKT